MNIGTWERKKKKKGKEEKDQSVVTEPTTTQMTRRATFGSQILHVLMASSKWQHAHVLHDWQYVQIDNSDICNNLKISRIIRLFCTEKHFKLGPASQLSQSSHICAHSQVGHYRPPVSSYGCFFEFDCVVAPARSRTSRVKSKNMHKQFNIG